MPNGQPGKNKVYIRGEIGSEFSYSHKAHGKRFYMADICTYRNSGYRDVVPLMAPEKLVDAGHGYSGHVVSINGQFHSFNSHGGGWRRLE